MVSYYPAVVQDQALQGGGRSPAQQEGTPGALAGSSVSYYERESRRRNRKLRDVIRDQADPNGILDLTEEQGASWDSIGISTALQALAWKVKQGAAKPSASDKRWHHLQILAYERLREGEARNLANTAWSMANISSMHFPFMTQIAVLAQHRATELKPQELSNLVWSCATVRYKDPPLLQALAAEVESFLEETGSRLGAVSCQDLANILWAFASLAFTGPTRLVACASGFVCDFKPQECANFLWSMAVLEMQDASLAESIAERALETLAEFRSQNISNFLWAYAKMGHRNNSMTTTLLDFCLPDLRRFSAQDLTTMVWACATMEYGCEQYWQHFSRELGARAQAILKHLDHPWFYFACSSLPLRLTEFKPQEVANFAWSLAVTQFQDAPGVASIVRQVVQVHTEFSCQSMANFIWAYAKLGYQDEDMISLVQAAAKGKMHALSEQDLSTTLWAFSTMQHRDDNFLDAFKAALWVKLQQPIKPQHASNILWALAVIYFRDEPFYQALATSVKRSVSSFSPQDLSCSIWACATVVYSDPKLTDLIAQQAADQLEVFDPQSVGNAVWGAAYLRTSVHSLYTSLSLRIGCASCLQTYNDKVLAMMVRAFLLAGEASSACRLFENLRRLDQNPGITAIGYWLHHCRDVQPCLVKEMQAMETLSRFQPCRYIQEAVLNACALRLAELGYCSQSVSLVHDLLEVNQGNIVARGLKAKLSSGVFAETSSRKLELPHWTLPARGNGHSGTDYDKQCRLLQHVLCTAKAGDATSVINAIEGFSVDGNGWLKIAGGGKGVVLDDLVTRLARQPLQLVLEFGCFVGYSSTRMAQKLVPGGGKVVSVEVDPIHACIARNVIEFAGVGDRVSICVGYSEDVIPHLKETCKGVAADAVFFDQRGTRFHIDLQMLESSALMKDQCVVCADNVLKPGAPHFLWYLQNSPMYELTVVSLREFATDRIEDWMAIGRYHPLRAAAMPAPPRTLDRVAFLTDKARARSCNADGPCEVDEDAWAQHAQAIRRAYEEVGIAPQIVYVQSKGGCPFVNW